MVRISCNAVCLIYSMSVHCVPNVFMISCNSSVKKVGNFTSSVRRYARGHSFVDLTPGASAKSDGVILVCSFDVRVV